jgi:DNA-binding NarL/FixJ family response regulator
MHAPASLQMPPLNDLGRVPPETNLGVSLSQMTDRQREVFRLLQEGCPTKTIARRLDLAVGTVKIHLAGIYRALGARSRLEALAIAHRAAGYATA